MAKIKINGDSSGYVEIAAPNAAYNNTLELGPGTKILTDKNTHTGNIGIGTDNPSVIFHSYHPTTNTVGKFESGDSSVNIRFRDGDTTNEIGIGALGNDFIVTAASGGERVRVTSAGNIGIGTTNPQAPFGGRALHLGNISDSRSVLTLQSSTTGRNSVYFSDGITGGNTYTGYIDYIHSDNAMTFGVETSERLRITSAGKVGINTTDPSYMLEVHNPDPGNDSKQSIQKWINTYQNTLELNMYGGTIDQCQFATVNAEQTLSFLTGLASGSVDSTQTSLLLTQNRDGWFQGPDTSNYGGGLFIGAEASPYGDLCALRDNNKRPLIYMGGQYPEITLAHTVASNTNHGPTIRFATYVQSTNTATGSQFVIGSNGSGTFLDIGNATAGQNVNVHNGIANYTGTSRLRVDPTAGAVKIPGHVIQVGYARHDPNSDTYTVVGQDTKSRSAAYLDFTPKYANSQLLIITRMHTRIVNANGCSYGIDVSGDSGSTWTALDGMSQRNAMDFFYKGDQVNHHYTGFCLTYISATNTNARRYSPWAQGWSGGTWEISYGHGEHSVTVLEIAGTI